MAISALIKISGIPEFRNKLCGFYDLALTVELIHLENFSSAVRVIYIADISFAFIICMIQLQSCPVTSRKFIYFLASGIYIYTAVRTFYNKFFLAVIIKIDSLAGFVIAKRISLIMWKIRDIISALFATFFFDMHGNLTGNGFV